MGPEEFCLCSKVCDTAQEGIKNATGHLRRVEATRGGMFRGPNKSSHHLQCTASNLSPGYGCELLTRLSLKMKFVQNGCRKSYTALFET